MKLHSVFRCLQEKGLPGTVRYAYRRLSEQLREYCDSSFDRQCNVDTAGELELSDVQVESKHLQDATWYEATPVSVIRHFLKHLPIRHEDHLFIDCGSGKGRVLLVAAEYPFSRIIGVEFSPELHRVAERNIRSCRNRRQRCFRIDSVCADAASYDWPRSPAVVYFFSPFRPPLFAKILNGLLESLRKEPRSTYIVYYGNLPECIQTLRQTSLECREVRLPYALAATSQTRVGLILHSPAAPATIPPG